MSTTCRFILAVVASIASGFSPASGQEQRSRVLDYYVGRAASVYESCDPQAGSITYSYLATIVQKKLGEDSRITSVDSTRVRLYYSFGQLDSQTVELPARDEINDFDLTIPNVFSRNYMFQFFPNDTGGSELAIGFDSDSSHSDNPSGIAQIDRNRYHTMGLHLAYDHKEGFERYSRSIRTTVRDGHVFPAQVTVIAGKRGILFTEYYRQEISISDLTIMR